VSSTVVTNLTWDLIKRLRDGVKAKLVLKGILAFEDANLAANAGVDAIIVSNHGGRVEDGAAATIEVLPEIVDAVGGRMLVLVDSGFRRGTDIVKALAIGAHAVCTGRPYLWGLGAFGMRAFSLRSVPAKRPPVMVRGEACQVDNKRRCKPMNNVKPFVAVVDDDLSVREALQGLLETAALEVGLYSSPRGCMQRKQIDAPSCIILDVRSPGSSGLDFQRELARAGDRTPIIFLTGYADSAMAIQAMKAGAMEFLTKPYHDQTLLEAVLLAIENDRARRASDEGLTEARRRLELLTPRERHLMALAVAGQSNKEIAGKMGISGVTAKVHHRQVMRKMRSKSIVELARTVELLTNHGIKSLSPLNESSIDRAQR
jgi:FixJ family two-component response regulator